MRQYSLTRHWGIQHAEGVDLPTLVIKLNGQNLSSDTDFRLYYSPSNSDVALRLLTHRASNNEDGYFMRIGRVDDQLENTKILPKEIVFCIDTSGSMRGEAKNADSAERQNWRQTLDVLKTLTKEAAKGR